VRAVSPGLREAFGAATLSPKLGRIISLAQHKSEHALADGPALIRVLHRDPGLGDGLSADQFARAALCCRAPLVRYPCGQLHDWPLAAESEPGFLGFLVLSGILSRRVAMGHLQTAELLGPGDLVRPWGLGSEEMPPLRVNWRVHGEAEIAILDRRFHAAAAQWPEIDRTLRERDGARLRSLTARLLIAQAPRISTRVHLLLWHLADRWGRRSAGGVVLPLRLSRTLLAHLVCSTRESVSRALSRLVTEGRVELLPQGFLLSGRGPVEGFAGWHEPFHCDSDHALVAES
jgi:CRP/FNR family transcriptional regulator, cyclic AMP receptor protein